MSRTDANRLMSRTDLNSTLILLQTAPLWFDLVKGILIRLHIRRLKLNEGPYAEAGGGALGASAPPLFVPGEKVPFFGNEISALFS